MRRFISTIILAAFFMTSVQSPAYAQAAPQGLMPRLAEPGVMVHLSPEFMPAHLQGITIHPDNALQFDFLIHKGDQALEGDQRQEEYKKLVKYFLASLTIPDEDQWVNLSPYENNRIIKDDFGKTEMGRDLLAEDYMLKQITSSLIYPEDGLGKKFWDKIYERAWSEYHTTDIPVNTFNKVWIVPDQAIVYESGNTAYILKSHLKVMLEEDYLSMTKHADVRQVPNINRLGSQVIRAIILPELEKEVNEGKNFANLRQMFSGMILATWYKKALKESLLGKVYADKAKVKGVDQDPKTNEEIYKRYLKAFKKGVFNYIKEDVDKYTQEAIPRKYFSGGWEGLKGAKYFSPDTGLNSSETGIEYIVTPETVAGLPLGTVDSNILDEEPIDKAAISLETPQETHDAAMAAIPLSPFLDHGTDTLGGVKSTMDEDQVEETKELEHNGKPLEIGYLKPIVLKIGGFTLKVSKIEDMDEGDLARDPKNPLNPKIGYVITDGYGGLKALRDGEVVRLGWGYNNDRFKWFIPVAGISRGHITISRRGDHIILFDGAVEDDGVYKPSKNGTKVQYTKVRPFQIGFKFGEHGSKINGGISTGRSGVGSRETIEVDFERDTNLINMYARIKAAIQSRYPQFNLTKLPGEIRGELLEVIFNEITDKVKFRDMVPQHTAGHTILVGDTIETGGVCRHMGILTAAIIERFIDEGVLSGRVYYVRGQGHGWAVYETSDGAYVYTFDVAKQFRGDQNGQRYLAGGMGYLYSEAYQEVKRLEEKQLGQAVKPVGLQRGQWPAVRDAGSQRGQYLAPVFDGGMANQAMVAAPAGVQALIDQGKRAVQALQHPETKKTQARRIGDMIEQPLKYGLTLEASALTKQINNHFQYYFGVTLGLSSRSIQISDHQVRVFGIPVVQILPKPKADDKKLLELVDKLIERIQNRYALNGVEITNAVAQARNAVNDLEPLKPLEPEGPRQEVALDIKNIFRALIKKVGLSPANFASELDGYFKRKFSITLELYRDQEAIQLVGEKKEKKMQILGKTVAWAWPRPTLIDTDYLGLVDALKKRIQERYGLDAAMKIPGQDQEALATNGGIDFNSANLSLQIKRDGRGVPLPLALQDMAQLSRIQGFVPEIIEIKPAGNLPILSELQQKLQSSTS